MLRSPTVTLHNGVEIPQVGLGVFRAEAGGQTERACLWAFELGYRHVDTAKVYGNEEDVGRAVRASGIPREELFITTKLWNADHGRAKVARAFDASLARLGLDYVDLYLVHWPVEGVRHETWEAMAKLLEAEKCRAIGVSNYTIRHLDELAARGGVLPAVNQVEFSPFLYQRELLEHCRAKNIALEAYSPLVKGKRMHHPVVARVAEDLQKTAAQILVRWAVQHGAIVIPKSSKRERIEENFGVFDFVIGEDAMRQLDACNEDLRTSWDPTDVV